MNLQDEINQANDKYGDFNSTHEVYGVLKEELDEFWELVKSKLDADYKFHDSFDSAGMTTRRTRMIEELTQIAAVALRAAKQLEEDRIKWV